jgi:hypothetical protein
MSFTNNIFTPSGTKTPGTATQLFNEDFHYCEEQPALDLQRSAARQEFMELFYFFLVRPTEKRKSSSPSASFLGGYIAVAAWMLSFKDYVYFFVYARAKMSILYDSSEDVGLQNIEGKNIM